MVRWALTGKYRRTRLFVFTLAHSRKAVRLLTWRSSAQIWCELHERAFRRLGGTVKVVVLDNLKEGVLTPDIYDPIHATRKSSGSVASLACSPTSRNMVPRSSRRPRQRPSISASRPTALSAGTSNGGRRCRSPCARSIRSFASSPSIAISSIAGQETPHESRRIDRRSELRLSGMAAVLDTRLRQAQAEKMTPIDLVSALVADELRRRQDRLLERRHKLARFRDPDRSLDTFDFDFNKKMNRALDLRAGHRALHRPARRRALPRSARHRQEPPRTSDRPRRHSTGLSRHLPRSPRTARRSRGCHARRHAEGLSRGARGCAASHHR